MKSRENKVCHELTVTIMEKINLILDFLAKLSQRSYSITKWSTTIETGFVSIKNLI